MGVRPAADKTALKAFGGNLTVAQFRRGFLRIDKYEWIARFYNPRELMRVPPVNKKYLYTLEPVRKTVVLDDDDEDPVVLIKQRCFG